MILITSPELADFSQEAKELGNTGTCCEASVAMRLITEVGSAARRASAVRYTLPLVVPQRRVCLLSMSACASL